MALKKIVFFTLCLSLIISYYSLARISQPRFSQEKQREITQPAYEVEVIITNVHVVVTDKNGKRMVGLKPENFEIYEDGSLQKLTNFYEVKGMEVYTSELGREVEKPLQPIKPLPQGIPQVKNKIIIYFDNWHLHPMNRNWSIKKLESFIRNNFSTENNINQGMVVSLDQKLEIIREFTSSQSQLLQAINQVKGRSGQSLIRARNREDMKKELNRMVAETDMFNKFDNYDRTLGYARNYVEAERNDLIYSLKSLNAFTGHLTGIEGKKIMIYVSDGLPINPAEEVFNFLDQAFPTGKAMAEAMNYDATKIFKEMTARCNANEITIYPINAQGLESRILSADKQEGWQTHRRGSGMVRATSRVRDDALKLMARETGGIPIINTNDIAAGLKRIEGDLQFYYSLGYVSSRRDHKYHAIKVKLAGVKGKYNVRVRQGYLNVSPEERIKEGVISRLFLQRRYNPMNVYVQMLQVESMPRTSRLRLSLKVLTPIRNLTLYKQGQEHVGQIKVYISLMDSDGNISPCHELSHDVKIPAEDYKIARRSSYPYVAEMYVEPGKYTISLAVKDVLGDTVNYLQLLKTIEKP